MHVSPPVPAALAPAAGSVTDSSFRRNDRNERGNNFSVSRYGRQGPGIGIAARYSKTFLH
ncbi:hypothetical protein [Pontibacter roseus]|uniref:hypothetical protein n=1 Tax=Pontibacter roseus TaxID=336989 RepID=UPI000399B61B|nr:hypothetical protein [Pontibacter roseus]